MIKSLLKPSTLAIVLFLALWLSLPQTGGDVPKNCLSILFLIVGAMGAYLILQKAQEMK